MRRYACFLLILFFGLDLPCAAYEIDVEESDADFKLKTMTGGPFTDFDHRHLPLKNRISSKRRNGKFVYKIEGLTAIRMGSGDPSFRMETLNGNILKKRQGQ